MPKMAGGGSLSRSRWLLWLWPQAAVCKTRHMQASALCGLGQLLPGLHWGTTGCDAVNENIPKQCAARHQANHFSTLVTRPQRMHTHKISSPEPGTGGPWASWAESVNALGGDPDLPRETELPTLKQKRVETPWRGCRAVLSCRHLTTSRQNGFQVQLGCDLRHFLESVSSS